MRFSLFLIRKCGAQMKSLWIGLVVSGLLMTSTHAWAENGDPAQLIPGAFLRCAVQNLPGGTLEIVFPSDSGIEPGGTLAGFDWRIESYMALYQRQRGCKLLHHGPVTLRFSGEVFQEARVGDLRLRNVIASYYGEPTFGGSYEAPSGILYPLHSCAFSVE
jgi:hypothetical protein